MEGGSILVNELPWPVVVDWDGDITLQRRMAARSERAQSSLLIVASRLKCEKCVSLLVFVHSGANTWAPLQLTKLRNIIPGVSVLALYPRSGGLNIGAGFVFLWLSPPDHDECSRALTSHCKYKVSIHTYSA